MYSPGSFQIKDRDVSFSLIREFNFGTIFSQNGVTPVATHIPFLVDTESGQNGVLFGHMARANPHWKNWSDQTPVLVVFLGPHTYISPGWYFDQVTVPTWNYAAVHVYGRPKLVHDPVQIRPGVEALVDFHEARVGRPWTPTKAESIMESELKGIVGFEIPIEQIECTYKFNQNRSRKDQEGVVRALKHTKDPIQQAVARIMKANLDNAKP